MAVLVNVLAVIVAVCALCGFPHAIVMLRCLLRFGVSWPPRVSGFSFECHREVDSWVRGAEACAGCTAVSVFTRILPVVLGLRRSWGKTGVARAGVWSRRGRFLG